VTHLPYIISAYGLGVLVPIVFAIDAWLRVRSAKRRLAAIDPRQHRR
jgi:cytochrome oxidase assembly protein ShyY1